MSHLDSTPSLLTVATPICVTSSLFTQPSVSLQKTNINRSVAKSRFTVLLVEDVRVSQKLCMASLKKVPLTLLSSLPLSFSFNPLLNSLILRIPSLFIHE